MTEVTETVVVETLPEDMRATLIDLCEQRALTYGLLSRLYRVEVDEAFYTDLCQTSFPAKTGNDLIDKGYRNIALYCAGHGNDALLDLAKDFVKVFIGHGNNAYSAAYPFESVYTSEKRLMMQEARDELLGTYAQAGLVLGDTWHDPEDHIALLLEYMGIMSTRTKEALEVGEDDTALSLLADQRAFLQRHIIGWVPMLAADMERFAQTDFYRGLAQLTLGYVQEDKAFLTSIIAEEYVEK